MPPLIAYARKPSQAASWDDADSAGGFSSLWYSVTGVHLGARKASPAGEAYASMVSTGTEALASLYNLAGSLDVVKK